MKLSLGGFRGALWTALGLAACGPTQATEGDGSGSGESSSSATSSPTTSGMYCGEELPDDPAPADGCVNPQPILQMGADGMVPTGFVLCDGGSVHREQKIDCIYVANETPCGVEGDPLNECASDLDCTASANGYCNVEGMDGGCTCSYGCTTDEECGAGNVCYCRGSFTECVPATCTTDADCGDYQCVYDSAHGFACHTPFDECRSDSDCPGADCPDCAPNASACAWTCQPSEYGCTTAGRPLLVDGREVRAGVGRAQRLVR